MARQDDLFFQEALRRKQAIQQQNANTNVAQVGVAQQDANSRAANVAQQAALQGLQNQGLLDRTNAAGGFGLQEAQTRNQGAASVANIQGGYGLQEAQAKAAVAQQPEYGAIGNPMYGLPGQSPYISTPKNQAAMGYLQQQQSQSQQQRPSDVPQGTRLPTAVAGQPQGGGDFVGVPPGQQVIGTGTATDPYRYGSQGMTVADLRRRTGGLPGVGGSGGW